MADEKKGQRNEVVASLATKLAAIGKEIGAVDKSGQNQQQRYNYIEYGEVAGRIRELLDKYHVIIVPEVESRQVDVVASNRGGTGYHYILDMVFTIINGDNPEEKIVAKWLGESADYGDKGINKAETSATKYFLMRLFNVSEKGEKEADAQQVEFVDSRPQGVRGMSARDVQIVKNAMAQAQTLGELRVLFETLGANVKRHPEIIAYKDAMKAALKEKGETDGGQGQADVQSA